jgi:hypothetical protein
MAAILDKWAREKASWLLEEVYSQAVKVSMEAGQVAGDKNDYYITLEQLERVLKGLKS